MSELKKFYTDTLMSVGLSVDVNDYVTIFDGEKYLSMKNQGTPIVLPTHEHLKTLIAEEDGKIKVKKVLFNPLDESAIKGDSVSLVTLKNTIENIVTVSVMQTADLLFRVMSNTDLQENIPVKIAKIIKNINDHKTPQIKHMVDKNTIIKWRSMYSDKSTHKAILKAYIGKKKSVNGKSYNRVTVINSPLLDALGEAKAGDKVNDVELRNKDIIVFTIILETLLNDLTAGDTLKMGSNDDRAPGFVSLMTSYIPIMKDIQAILKQLKFVDEDTYQDAFVNLKLNTGSLGDLNRFAGELKMIPSALDISQQVHSKGQTNMTLPTKAEAKQNQASEVPETVADLTSRLLGKVSSIQTNVTPVSQPAPSSTVISQPHPTHSKVTQPPPQAMPPVQHAPPQYTPPQQPQFQQQPQQQQDTSNMSITEKLLNSSREQTQYLVNNVPVNNGQAQTYLPQQQVMAAQQQQPFMAANGYSPQTLPVNGQVLPQQQVLQGQPQYMQQPQQQPMVDQWGRPVIANPYSQQPQQPINNAYGQTPEVIRPKL